ncbi:MAG: DUF5995 family protein [Marinirhabdus sp.]|nr:DUF5995 family protein [Marinirhabdus sp.]
MQLARTIDEVLTLLDDIIEAEIELKRPLAYFPILYKLVTQRIKTGIENHEFENNHRMEVLDVIFANRYIKAYHDMKQGHPVTKSWEIPFSHNNDQDLLIMQHLLLGINAHINLDLGIAVSETVGEHGSLQDFENDFTIINAILASMVDDVQDRIGRVSPLFYLLQWVGKGREDKIVSFSINTARDGAWLFANEYHLASNPQECIDIRDSIIGTLALKLTRTKSKLLKWTIKSIRWFENKDVGQVAAVLRS